MSETRLAYLLKKFPRLSETFVLHEILAQERLGRAIRVYARRAPDDEPSHAQYSHLRAPVTVLPGLRELDPWSALVEGDAFDRQLLDRVVRTVRSCRRWSYAPLSGLLSEALSLLARFRAEGIAHVHVHFASDAAIVAYLVRQLGGPSYSVTMHAKDIYRNTRPPALIDRVVAESDFVITVCDANVEHLRAHLSEAAFDKVRRIYNGIDVEWFSTPPAAEVARDTDHVLAIGRLVEKKGFDVLLDAIARLRRTRPLRVTLIGEGEERERLAAQIEQLDLAGSVDLVGGLPQERVREFMQRATIFCLPCVTAGDGNRDALPTVLLEALAMRLPSISTPVVGVAEILAGGEAGVLVPENDPRALADAISTLVDDPRRRLELAAAGRARVEREFDLRRQADKLAALFPASTLPVEGVEAAS